MATRCMASDLHLLLGGGDRASLDCETIEHALAHQLPDKVEAAYRRGTALPKR